MEKAINVEIKALLQPPSGTQKIDAKCLQGYRPAKKEDKDFGKNKSTDIPLADILNRKQLSSTHQISSTHSKKNQNH